MAGAKGVKRSGQAERLPSDAPPPAPPPSSDPVAEEALGRIEAGLARCLDLALGKEQAGSAEPDLNALLKLYAHYDERRKRPSQPASDALANGRSSHAALDHF